MFNHSWHSLACFMTNKPVSGIFTLLYCYVHSIMVMSISSFFALWKIFYSSLVLVIFVSLKLQHFVFLLFQVICGVNSYTLFFNKMPHRHTWSRFYINSIFCATDNDRCFLFFLFWPTGISSILLTFLQGN